MKNPATKNLFVFIIFILCFFTSFAQLKICSWNLENFGRTKSDSEVLFIADILKDFDVVAIQEVVAKDPGGAQAVARLADALNRTGSKWNYIVSDITSSSAYKAERYAFLWKPSRVTLTGKPWLEKQYQLEIDREPYYATFSYSGKAFTLVNFHAITKSMQPETEIKYFKFLPAQYPSLNLVFCGDFNCPQSHTVFNPLKAMGYQPAFENQKTSLRQTCIHGDCLASEFDNFFVNKTQLRINKSGIVAFYKSFSYFVDARKISDHVPVWVEVDWR